MNRKMRELKSDIEKKLEEVKSLTSGEQKDTEKASTLMDEVESLQKEYDLEKRMFAFSGKDEGAKPQEVNEEHMEKETKGEAISLAKGVRAAINPDKFGIDKAALSATTGANGGYLVPEDNLTKINNFKEAEGSVLPYITVENVTTAKGTRVFQKRGGVTGFAKMGTSGMTAGEVNASSSAGNQIPAPAFEQLNYSIEKYAGFMPVPRDLVDDSDANIESMCEDWLHKNQRKTDNKEVFTLLGADSMSTGWKAIASLEDIKKAVNVDLEDFAGSVAIYTNSDGLNWLDSLKDTNNRPLLGPIPNEPKKMQLSIGTSVIPVIKFPNSALASTAATSGTGGKIPFMIGDMKEAIVKFDRKMLTIDASNTAAIGSLNAFASDMTLLRGIFRADYAIRDSEAIFKGYVATPKAAS